MSSAAATVGRQRASRDIVGQLVLRVSNVALGIAVTLLIVRGLGDAGFGQWSTLLAVAHLVGYFGSMGLENVAVERAAGDPARQARWMGALITLRLALGLPVALASLGVMLAIADSPEMRLAAVFVSAMLLAGGLTSARAVFQLQVRNTITTGLEMTQGILWAAVVIALVVTGAAGLTEFAIGFSAVGVAVGLAQLVLAMRMAPIAFAGAREMWPALVRLGIPVGIGGLLVLGYGYIDQMIVFQLAGAEEAGLYGAVYRIFERVQILPMTLMTTLFPIIVAARDSDPARAIRVIRMAIDYLLMASLPALTITLAGPEPIVRLLFGAEFAESAPALPILMAAFAVVSLGYLAGYLIIAYGLQRRFIAFAGAALVFNVAANFAFVPAFGFLAAAWVTLLTEILVVGLAMHAVAHKVGFVPVGRRLGSIVLAAGLVGVLGLILRLAGLPVAVWVPAAAVAYPMILFQLGVLDPGELRGLMRRGSGA